MEAWQKGALGAVAAVALACGGCVGGGYLIDPDVEVGTERVLAAPPATLYPFLSTASGLDRWWAVAQEGHGAGERMTVTRKGGPEEGPGLVAEFKAGDLVIETWTVKAAEPPGRIVYDVDFAGMMTVERTLTLVPAAGGTNVTWAETGRVDNPIVRWMMIAMPASQVEGNFTEALGALEKAATAR